MKLLSNTTTSDHDSYIRDAFSRSHDVLLAVAFLKQSGLRKLIAEMRSLLDRGGGITAIVGLDFFLTEPAALHDLHALKESGALKLFLFEQSLETFHPKYYRFQSEGGKIALVGSANLTAGGLQNNVEASIVSEVSSDSDFAAECDGYESTLLASPKCAPATLIGIEIYRRRYEAWHAVITPAVKKARVRVQAIGTKNVIDSYLVSYRRDEKEKLDLGRRKQNYVRAKAVLREIANTAELDEAQFRDLYEKLVGAPGQKGFWHSGGLQRQKNFVIAKHRRAHRFIADIAANSNSTPRELFKRGDQGRRGITGLGPNVMTEIFNALKPNHFPVLNNNPLTGLKELGCGTFPAPALFSPGDYERYTNALATLRDRAGFRDFGETDHFLNFIYWKLAKPNNGRPANSYATG